MSAQNLLSTLRKVANTTTARNLQRLGSYGEPRSAEVQANSRLPVPQRSLQGKLDVATRMSEQEKAIHPGWNNHDDAVRHSEWSKRMADELGPTFSTAIGIGHEATEMWPSWLGGEGQPISEMIMDLHNNAEGVRASREGRDIDPRRMVDRPVHPGEWARDQWQARKRSR